MLKKTKMVTMASLGLILSYGILQAENSPSSISVNSTSEAASAQGEKAEKPIDMKKLSEAFGNFIGRNLQSPGLSFDLDSIIQGIREGAQGKPSPLSEKEYEEMMAAVQEKAFKEMSATNLKAADEFMKKNKTEPGITVVVPDKLQYTVLSPGTGAVVEAHASPKILYTGKYQDGTVFGSSEEMGGPITIPLDQTIPGFSKGIVGMKEGEKRRLFVHPDLGYGTTGQLPPNELLIFDIEVVKANSDDAKGNKLGQPGTSGDDEDGDDDYDDDDYYDDEDEGSAPQNSSNNSNSSK
jgi:peptidylprolyl isomerase